MTNKTNFFFYFIFCGALCSVQFLLGCEESAKQAKSKPKQMSSSQLLRTPLHTLEGSVASSRQGFAGKIRLPEVTQVQVLWRDRRKKEHLFDLYRDGKSWWAVEMRNRGESWGHTLQSFSITPMLKALNQIKPAERSEFSPEHLEVQLSLFAANKRFLMRMIQAPVDRGPTAVYRGEWFVYYHGSLYQQPAKGPLGLSVPRLVRKLKRLSRQRGGMLLPLNSAGMDFRRARFLAKQLHKQRLSLRRCFKKRRFPSSIGPLKMKLIFGPSGVVKKRRILTRPHTKFKVVWCVWWFAKRFKVAPFGLASIEYDLIIPPGGP